MKAITCLAVYPKRIKPWTVFIQLLLKQSEASLVIDDICALPHMKYCLLNYHFRVLLASGLIA